jgi:hypothetical protein
MKQALDWMARYAAEHNGTGNRPKIRIVGPVQATGGAKALTVAVGTKTKETK